MYRRGQTSESIDTAGAVFATTSGLTVRNTRLWYESEGGHGFPPIVHQRALSNYAWLKKPASASRLKVHELTALCSAALRPSRKAWANFLKHLRKLEESGELTSDEATAIVASDLTEGVLLEFDVNEDSDASSVAEVVERVKASYRETSDEKERLALAAADASAAEARQLRGRANTNSRLVAQCLSWGLAGIATVSLVVGTAVSIAAAMTGDTPSWPVVALAVVPLLLIALCGSLWGFNVRSWRRRVEDRTFARVLGWMTAEP